jgi:hypothetical protein
MCIFVFARAMTLKLTLKVNEFRGRLILAGSVNEVAQIKNEIAQIGPFFFELSAFLYFSRLDLQDQRISWSPFPKVTLV